jgi:hypothetical protein
MSKQILNRIRDRSSVVALAAGELASSTVKKYMQAVQQFIIYLQL